MKKTVLTLTIGIFVGLLAGSISGAFAAVSDTVEAQFAKFTLIINKGEPIEIEPLTYKGTTYLPVREAANLTGYDLTYKADSRTIELNKSMDSISAELEQIIEPEGDGVNESVSNDKSIEEQLKEVNIAISSTQHALNMASIHLQSAIDNDFPEETIQSIKDGITVTEERLAKFQARKSELESQLQSQTP